MGRTSKPCFCTRSTDDNSGPEQNAGKLAHALCPRAIRNNNAWLLYWLGICRLHFKPAESQDIIERAFDLFKTQDDLTGMALSCASIVEAHHLLWHDFTGLSRWTAEMTDILKRGKGGFPPQIEAILTISMFAAVMHHDPGHPDMPRLVKETRQLMRQVPDIAQRLMIASLLEIYYSWLGETEEVELIIEELRPEVKSPAALPAAAIFFCCMEAVFLWNIGVFGASVDTALEGLALAYSTGIHVFDARLIAQGIFSTLMSGDLDKAAELLEQLAESTDFSKMLQAAHYNYLSAGYSLCRGELTQALSQAEKTVASIVKSGFPFAQMISFQMIALVLFDRGEPDRAFPFLDKARRLAERIKSRPAEYVNSLSEAYFFLAKAGAKEEGLEALRCAFSLGRQHDIVNYYGMRRSMIIFLCLKALEEGIEVEYTQNLIIRCKLAPETPPLEIEDWPWPLKIYTLGRFKIIKEGRRVYFPGKVRAEAP